MTLAVYEARGSLIPRAMDSNAIHLMRAWAVVNSIVDAEAIHWRMDKPLATEDGCVESPVNMVSCSAVSAFVRRVKRVVLAEWPDSGHTGMRDDLSGVRRTEKKSDPARRPMTRMSQFCTVFRIIGWDGEGGSGFQGFEEVKHSGRYWRVYGRWVTGGHW